MSLVLNIDTATSTASVSIARDGMILQAMKNEVQKDHAAFVHTAVRDLLDNLKLKTTDLDAVAVSAGPGSYTGLRVGFAAAKGLCYALDISLISISTLLLMTKAVVKENPGLKNYLFCPMIDARRMEVYTALYDNDMHELKHAHSLILSQNSFDNLLAEKNILFFGNGSKKWQSLCNADRASFSESFEILTVFAELSFQYFCDRNFTQLSLSVPLYAKEFHSE